MYIPILYSNILIYTVIIILLSLTKDSFELLSLLIISLFFSIKFLIPSELFSLQKYKYDGKSIFYLI